MATYLLLDKDRRAVNVIEWDERSDHDHGAHDRVKYDGTFYQGGLFDGEKVINPDPDAATEAIAPKIIDGEAMSVLA
jgi:hypothetical protein